MVGKVANVVADSSLQNGGGTVVISGELKRWHKLTLTLDGPYASETGGANPFLDHRMDVVFTNGELTYTVPGYFAGDGDAANNPQMREPSGGFTLVRTLWEHGATS